MLKFRTFGEITVQSSFLQYCGGLGPKWAPGPMKNHRNYCCFSMPAEKPEVHVIIGDSSILIDFTEKCVLSGKSVEFTEMSGFE